MYMKQEAFVFQPDKLPDDFKFSVADTLELRIPVDGAVLSALHMKLPDPRGLVFYLHGNGGNLASWFPGTSELFRRANFDLVMIDYRGYGKSSGYISSEAEMHADVLTAWNRFAPSYNGKSKVVFGRSIGTGLAAELSSQVEPDLTVLVSAYTRIPDLARARFWWVPAVLIRYVFDTVAIIGNLKSPVLLIHGDRDGVIGSQHSQALKHAAPASELLIISGAGHNDISHFDAYNARIISRLAAL